MGKDWRGKKRDWWSNGEWCERGVSKKETERASRRSLEKDDFWAASSQTVATFFLPPDSHHFILLSTHYHPILLFQHPLLASQRWYKRIYKDITSCRLKIWCCLKSHTGSLSPSRRFLSLSWKNSKRKTDVLHFGLRLIKFTLTFFLFVFSSIHPLPAPLPPVLLSRSLLLCSPVCLCFCLSGRGLMVESGQIILADLFHVLARWFAVQLCSAR